jgi:very-short-patch-repair endonuclease
MLAAATSPVEPRCFRGCMNTSSVPFLGSEAMAAGRFTKRTLHTRNQLIYRNVYVPHGEVLTAADRAVAAWLWSGRRATVAGLSASALHGASWIAGDEPAELTRSEDSFNGIIVHRERLRDDEVCDVEGIPVTTPARTAFDLGRRKGLEKAVIRVDALANATGLTADRVQPLVQSHRGARGLVQLREVLELMDGGAESPQETRTRLLLVDARFRRPQTQIEVLDGAGYPFARIDMGWEEHRVGVEYDGEQHWTDSARFAHDIDRHAMLTALGWRIVRVSADLLRYRRPVILQRAFAALEAAGCPWLAECVVDLRQVA